MIKVFGLLAALLIAFAAHAGDDDFVAAPLETLSGQQANSILQQVPSVEAPSDQFASPDEEFAVVYDPKELLDSAVANLSPEIAAEIPQGPSSPEDVQHLQGMNQEDVNKFINKKQAFLGKLNQWMLWGHLPKGLRGKILKQMNDQFYVSAPVIARANAQGAALRLQVGGGIGMNSILANKVRNTRLGRWLPKYDGFYLMLGIGVSLMRVNVDGKHTWVMEFFADVSTLQNVKTFLSDAGIGLSPNYVAEIQQPDVSRLREFDVDKAGPAGLLTRSNDYFSYGPSLGVGFPPFVSAFTFYGLRQKRFTFLRLRKSVKQEAAPEGGSAVNSCSAVFSF